MRTFATAGPIVAADHYHIPPLERIGDTLLSVLRQLRAGYDERPDGFPHSIVLCGVRDVRDYRVYSTAENRLVLGGSAFNIKSESLRLGDFSEQEIRALIAQHTAQTGQAFTEGALELNVTRTGGQPWLVNALWPQGGRERRWVVECKVRRGDPEPTITQGVMQTRAYLDRCDAEAGHLIVFDRAPQRSWEQKIFRREAPPEADAPITVSGMCGPRCCPRKGSVCH